MSTYSRGDVHLFQGGATDYAYLASSGGIIALDSISTRILSALEHTKLDRSTLVRRMVEEGFVDEEICEGIAQAELVLLPRAAHLLVIERPGAAGVATAFAALVLNAMFGSLAALTFMGLGPELVSLVNFIYLGLRQIAAQFGQQYLDARRALPPDTIKDGSGLAHGGERGLERILRVHDHYRLLFHRFFDHWWLRLIEDGRPDVASGHLT